MLLENLITEYINGYKKEADLFLEKYKKIDNLKSLLVFALPGADPDGEFMYDRHQYRIINKRKIYSQILNEILNNEEYMNALQTPSNFEDVLQVFYEIKQVKGIKNFGPLNMYDTSLRVSAKYNVYPKVIYLHTGALQGAKKILGQDYNNHVKFFNEDKKFPDIKKEVLPVQLHVLEAYDIENFLCIYKNQIEIFQTGKS